VIVLASVALGGSFRTFRDFFNLPGFLVVGGNAIGGVFLLGVSCLRWHPRCRHRCCTERSFFCRVDVFFHYKLSRCFLRVSWL